MSPNPIPNPSPADIGRLARLAIVYYQPIVDLTTGQLVGAEALARFPNPDGTVRPPGEIIEHIERSTADLEAFYRAIFQSIARTALPILDRHPELYVSVNVPPIFIGCGRLRVIMESLELVRYAHQLVCEVTERQVLTDAGRNALAIAHGMGIRIAMDDFGTGQSVLKQLIGLPLDIIKIDKSQVDPLVKDPTADRLLRGVVALAMAMRVKVVAEGVETRQQAFFLRAAGVDSGQGWLWSKAVSAHDLEQQIRTGFADQIRWTSS
jgi:sensor c-di-GMP phosphodiesterase-like protein